MDNKMKANLKENAKEIKEELKEEIKKQNGNKHEGNKNKCVQDE